MIKRFRRLQMSFSAKIIFLLIITMVCMSAIFNIILISVQKEALKSSLNTQGTSLVRMLAHTVRLAVFTENSNEMLAPVEGLFLQDDVVEVVIWNTEGKVLLQKTKDPAEKLRVNAESEDIQAVLSKLDVSNQLIMETKESFIYFSQIFFNISSNTEENWYVDEVDIGSEKDIVGHAAVILSKEFFEIGVRNILIQTCVSILIFLCIGILITFFIIRKMTEPLQDLMMVIKKNKGDTTAPDDLAILTATYDSMIKDLERSFTTISELNDGLEEDIAKRKRLEGILLRRDKALAAVTDMAVYLLLNSDWQAYAEKLIARLGADMAYSRVHIFQHHYDEKGDLLAKQKYEWVAEHINGIFDGRVTKSFSYKELDIERWVESFRKGELISGNSLDFPENEVAWLNNNQIKSLVYAPILTGENCWGFIGFEECSVERKWEQPELDALKTTATLFGTAILRQKMESDIANQQAQIAHAGRLTALGEMASGIGHEIHQPLSVINLNAEACQSYLAKLEPDGLATEAAADITGQVNKIKRLIDNMRRFSRLSSGQLEYIDLSLPLKNSLTFYQEQFRLNNIQLNVEIRKNLPLVRSDIQKFEQILVNFLSNARHAVDTRKKKEVDLQKEVAVTLDYMNVSSEELSKLTFSKDEKTSNQIIRVEVKDNGIGMDDETKKRCLEPFFTTKDVGDGTGLGLSVSYAIIQELNFHLEIESRKGKGTVFRLYIPVEKEKQK